MTGGSAVLLAAPRRHREGMEEVVRSGLGRRIDAVGGKVSSVEWKGADRPGPREVLVHVRVPYLLQALAYWAAASC